MNFSSELLNKGNKTPAFSISIEGRDITTVLDNRLMSLTLTDNRGFEADQLDLELDDADGKIVLPRRGAVITLALGWKGQPLFPKGAFTVDEIEHTGAPDRLTIRARSADFRETLNTRREKSWHKTTVGEVVKEIAARHKLKMALGKDLSDKPVEHIDQTNESDGSFLMRLARQYGAIASVKNGKRSRAITWWVQMKTCWYLIAPMPTGATPNGRRKCSGNACNAALRHSRYNWQKVGQISTRKCQ